VQKLEDAIAEIDKVYHLLAGERISDRLQRAFDKSFEAGVLWNRQIFSLLDMAKHRRGAGSAPIRRQVQ
jgi:hypothetical protein